ncbi:hypothetical protein TNCV_3446161 [Trichonephila clavipes]|nr:hypothetical protein TNCV_3446161 [Trichonephila clavipes]
MPLPGFEPSPYGTSVNVPNHYTGWAAVVGIGGKNVPKTKARMQIPMEESRKRRKRGTLKQPFIFYSAVGVVSCICSPRGSSDLGGMLSEFDAINHGIKALN